MEASRNKSEDNAAQSVVRSATIEDAAAIAALSAEVFTIERPWSESAVRNAIESGRAVVLIAKADAKATPEKINTESYGYAICYEAGGEGELESIAVKNEARKQGVGGALLKKICAELKNRKADRLFLEVRRTNEVARNFYRENGFYEIGIRKDFYTETDENGDNAPVDAILMRKDLDE